MRLESFRVQFFRCIHDSRVVNVGERAALVGVNDHGKTAVLRALEKFNVDINRPFQVHRDFPRKLRNRMDKDADYPVVTVVFSLDSRDRDELSNIEEALRNTKRIEVTRYYSGVYQWKPDPDVEIPEGVAIKEVTLKVTQAGIAAADRAKQANDIKRSETIIEIVQDFEAEMSNLEDTHITDPALPMQFFQRVQAVTAIPGTPDVLANLKKTIDELVKRMQPVRERVWGVLKNLMPRFIYFGEYNFLPGRVSIRRFIDRAASDRPGEYITAEKIFTLAGMDVEHLNQLLPVESAPEGTPGESYDMRRYIKEEASVAVTHGVAEFWAEDGYRFYFDVDADDIRILVSRNDGPRIELELSGKGVLWFLSFYTVFTAELTGAHSNCILLLDEPGLHLHAARQKNLLAYLEKLSKKNQLIYTTHLPFMIDKSALHTVKTVTIDENKGTGTKISNENWATNDEALIPLQVALGLSILDSLFIGAHNLLVEGMTELWFLEAMKLVCMERGGTTLEDRINITPAGNAQKIAYMASFMTGQKLSFGILFDYDDEGRKVAQELAKNGIVDKRNSIVYVNSVLGKELNSTIEDLLTKEFYVQLVNEAYQEEKWFKQISKEAVERKMVNEELMLVDAIESFFPKKRKRRKMVSSFSKLHVAAYFSRWVPSNIDLIPDDVVNTFSQLFGLLNIAVP